MECCDYGGILLRRAEGTMGEKIESAAADGRAAVSTLGEFAFQRIREDILSGRLAPALRLRFQMLQDMYDLNVGTLREGLARLTAEGLVLVEGQKGFRVADVSRDDLNDLTELRMLVDTLALRLSIERGDLEWKAKSSPPSINCRARRARLIRRPAAIRCGSCGTEPSIGRSFRAQIPPC